MKKRVLAMLLSMAMTATLLAGCGSSSDSTGDTTDGDGAKEYDVLRVAMMPFGGNVPAQYAYDQGYFEELGLNVEFYQFANGAGINEALAAKEVDVGVSGLAMIFSLASGTCKMIAPILEQIAEEHPELTIAKMNIDDDPSVAISYGVTGIPTLLLFENGQVKQTVVGYREKADLEALLNLK